jgi:hypothetical protein
MTETRVYNKKTPRFGRKLLIGVIFAAIIVVVAIVVIVNGLL